MGNKNEERKESVNPLKAARSNSVMLCIGLEGTAHTAGVGISDEKGTILANIALNYFPKEGIHPRKAAEHHTSAFPQLISDAVKKAGSSFEDIDLVSFSQGPGLAPCLKITGAVARALALSLNKPIIGVNHCAAHVEIGKVKTGAKDPITLYVSGGNSQVIGETLGKYRVFGETLDIAIGNAIDKFARELDLGFPGGPLVEKEAKGGKYIPLPYTVKGMDFSFTGIVSDALRKKDAGASLKDLCFSFQETAFAMLTEVSERALSHTEKGELLLTGGVAANSRLKDMLEIMCRERKAKFYAVPREFAGDNGAMIAWQGIRMHKESAKQDIKDTSVRPGWRVDD